MTYNEWKSKLDEREEARYDSEWARAIDESLAKATLDAFRESVKEDIKFVLDKMHSKGMVSENRSYEWLKRRIKDNVDAVNKIIHMKYKEDESDECTETGEQGGETAAEH